MRSTEPARRILFCADGHSVHAQQWLRLLEGAGWDVHAFVGGAVPPCPIDATFHTLDAKAENFAGNRVKPFWPFRRGVARVCRLRFGDGPDADSMRLAALIRKLRPAIVHSLRMQDESYTVLGALSAIREVGARWIVSLWGSDVCAHVSDVAHRERIRGVMESCDYVTADCRRDLRLSCECGATPEKLFFNHMIPGNGGIDVEGIADGVRDPYPPARRIVLFPHAREDRFHLWAPVLEALRRAGDELRNVELVFLGADEATERAIADLPETLRHRCRICRHVPREEVLALLGRSRAMVKPSLSDGTPNVMLEAMAAGALPVMSPLESIREWLADGINGLLAHNNDPAALARAIVRACRDDALVRAAAADNLELVRRRADREKIRRQILSMYEVLAESGASAAGTGERPAEEVRSCVSW
jgi:glycosyltransferase involved in cell wall biosynthesis